MKENDIVTIFGDPVHLKYPIDQARLIKKLSEHGILEQWSIEYINDEGHKYTASIKKDEIKQGISDK